MGMDKKLYTMEKFEDPALEKSRRNALNAKRNRERQREEKKALEENVQTLSAEVETLKNANDELRKRSADAEAGFDLAKKALSSLAKDAQMGKEALERILGAAAVQKLFTPENLQNGESKNVLEEEEDMKE